MANDLKSRSILARNAIEDCADVLNELLDECLALTSQGPLGENNETTHAQVVAFTLAGAVNVLIGAMEATHEGIIAMAEQLEA